MPNEVIKAMLERRSIREYKPDMVPQDKIDEIIKAGLYAASGMDFQPAIIIEVTCNFQNIIREHRPKRPTEQKKSGTPSETARRHPFRKDNNIIAHLPRNCQSGTG